MSNFFNTCFFIIFLSHLAHAQSFEFLGLGGPPGPPQKSVRIQSSFYDSVQNSSDTNATSLQPKSVALSIPVHIQEKEAWTVGATYNHFEILTQSRLKNGTEIPAVFRGTNLSLGWNKREENDKFWGASVGLGSPSDQPYADEKQIALHTVVSRGLDKNENHQWILLLYYSNNSTFLRGIPLPGAAYSYSPSPKFRGIFGIPFAFVKWDFQERWAMTFLIFAFQKIKLDIAYKIVGPIQASFGIESDQQVFMRKDRTKNENRFYYDERKVYVSFKSPLHAKLFAELTVGHSFDRSLFEVDKYADRKENNLLLGNSAYLFAQLSSRF